MRVGAKLYRWKGRDDDPQLLLSALHRTLPTGSVFAGATAAWLLGLDVDPVNPVDIVAPQGSGIRSRPGLNVRRCRIRARDTVFIRGLPATVLRRTLRDLCVQWPPVEALVAIDIAVRLGLTDTVRLGRDAESARGRAGASRLRALSAFAEPAESPMETRLRWLLIQAGLPRPQVQTDLNDRAGRFVGRADLYYPIERLVVEFDGGNHRERMVDDDRRQNLLINAGFRILRFTAADLRQRPRLIEAQVRGALMATPLNALPAPNARRTTRRSA